ncbi:MAG: tetratricopeptide repeat protein, partial [Polyangiaceae bacterium]|nr:tetratricopeptide repeat protein [Polyangiaceae bacterium]
LDPWLAIAYTNLGNVRFRRGDADAAEVLYRRALEIDVRQPEAQYNLGYVMLERGHPELSIPLFHGALESDSNFADAYFNLAMAYEQVGETGKARPFWKSYIALEPQGTWTEIAKRHL